MTKMALIVVDVQNDFLPGGALAVTGRGSFGCANAEGRGFAASGGLETAPPSQAREDARRSALCEFFQAGGDFVSEAVYVGERVVGN